MKTYVHFLSSRSVLLRMRNFSEKVVEKIKTHILCSVTFFSPKNRAVYEIMWKYFVEPGRSLMTIWLMRIAFSIPKATNTQSEYVTLIVFPPQQWLHEHASMLHYSTLPVY